MQSSSPVPALLWEGDEETLIKEVFSELKRHFCVQATNLNNDSCACIDCRKLDHHQHQSVLWLSSEKNYSVSDIDLILNKACLALNNDEQFFFVLPKAETLNLSCANRLLKILEEPPKGYRFIILTSNIQSILPTIASRCLIRSMYATKNAKNLHPLLSFFLHNENLEEADFFEKTLKDCAPSDHESSLLLHELYGNFAQQLISHYQNETENIGFDTAYLKSVLKHLTNMMKHVPQSGSSTLFWRNLYLSFPRKKLRVS